MKATDRLYDYLRKKEALRLNAYLDSAGVATIGYGATHYEDGHPVLMGDTITEERAEILFDHHVRDCENTVNKFVYVPLTQDQFDALVSFVFNVGSPQFQTSTLLRILNKKDYLGAANQLDRWVYVTVKDAAGNKVKKKEPGLVNRRKADKKLFNGEVT